MRLKTIFRRQMGPARLEHVNINVVDPNRTAAMLCRMFGWSIRWEGPSMDQGTTVHVGSKVDYLALYSNDRVRKSERAKDTASAGLNHVAVVVDDLQVIERRVVSEGFIPHSFADYEPGHRFYFHDFDGLEYEVVSYATSEPSFREQVKRMRSVMAQNSMVTK